MQLSLLVSLGHHKYFICSTALSIFLLLLGHMLTCLKQQEETNVDVVMIKYGATNDKIMLLICDETWVSLFP